MDPNFEGQRVKGESTPHIYLVLDGLLRHIPNPVTYENLFASPWQFQTLNQDIVDSLPKGNPLLDDTGLYKTKDDPKVYLIDQGYSGQSVKRWIVNPESFNRYGFQWDKILTVGKPLLENQQNGANIGH